MVVGVDVSSRRIDLAWLEDGRPCRWHQELGGGKHDDALIDRLRRIHIQWPKDRERYIDEAQGILKRGLYDRVQSDVTHIAIEYPYARGDGIPALWSTVGIITRQAPPWAEVAWVNPKDIRAAIGSKNTKYAAHEALISWACVQTFDARIVGELMHEWTPDELDALVACIGWTKILEGQDA